MDIKQLQTELAGCNSYQEVLVVMRREYSAIGYDDFFYGVQILEACVINTGARRAPELSLQYDLSMEDVEQIYQVIADLMYRAVRIGGVPCSGLPWRWGYGWPSCE